jgi:hypothetical protein
VKDVAEGNGFLAVGKQGADFSLGGGGLDEFLYFNLVEDGAVVDVWARGFVA